MKKGFWKLMFAIAALVLAGNIGKMDARAAAGGTSFDDAIVLEFDEEGKVECSKSYLRYVDKQDTAYKDGVYYKFNVPSSGLIRFSGMIATADSEDVYVYDATKIEFDKFANKKEGITYDMYLLAGDYYLRLIGGNRADTQKHEFTLVYTDTKETTKESQDKNNNLLLKASPMTLGKDYVGQVGQNDLLDYYKFELPSSGKVTIEIDLNTKGIEYTLYDLNGNEMEREIKVTDIGTGYITLNWELTKGNYYLALNAHCAWKDMVHWTYQNHYYYGTHTLKTKFVSADESFMESDTSSNNAINTASEIKLDTEYKGQLAMNDADDYYKVTVPTDGTLTVSGSSNSLSDLNVAFYTATGNKLVDKWFRANSAGVNNFTLDRECSAGIYYINISKGSTGNYTFSAKVTPKETPVSSIKLDRDKLELKVGETATIKAVASPENASNKAVTWSSSNTSIVTVNASGTITAVKAGTATITATAADGSKVTASCTVTVKSPEGWSEEGGKMYWYEKGTKQGTYDDPQGVLGDGTVRGREIYDPGSDGWYWLDSVYGGAKACSKEVWMPYIYQNEAGFDDAEIAANAANSGDMAAQVTKAIKEKSGKWVRYDANGKMYKEWYTVTGKDAELYPDQAGNTYYYDPKTGLMAKGTVTINGKTYHFDEVTGALDK